MIEDAMLHGKGSFRDLEEYAKIYRVLRTMLKNAQTPEEIEVVARLLERCRESFAETAVENFEHA